VEELEFKKYLNERVCWCGAISRYFNGFNQSCDSSMRSCDLCLIRQEAASRVQQAVRRRQQYTAHQIEVFAHAVRIWKEYGCLRCFCWRFLAQGSSKGKKAEEICSGYTDVVL
jgi:hypothetical protein